MLPNPWLPSPGACCLKPSAVAVPPALPGPCDDAVPVAALTVLTYEYVEDILERRKPHRRQHLAHVKRWSDERGLVLGGATGDPPSGALFVFEGDPAEVEAFVAADPYGAAGLIGAARIEPWTVVTARRFDRDPVG